jgi:peptide/nickel transport system substrate-binding protein
VADGKTDTISGIETPDDKTIIFHLDSPAGDFQYRVAMPAVGPIPTEVTDCFTKAGDYGRYLIATGPYMIEGSDQLDITSCDTMKAISGFNPEKFLHMVRNPNYDPATDSPEVRSNYPDRFEFAINSNADDIFAQVKESIIDEALAGETGKQIKEYTEDEDLTNLIKFNPDDSNFYLSMNLTQPPFDDIHVRKAMNFVMDKAGLIRAWGGPLVGDPATHTLVPSLAPPELDGYDPYPSPDFAGDATAAMEEMKQSKYDTDQDGICDAPECKGVINIMGTTARDKGMIPVIEASAAKIGVEFKTRQVDDPYSLIFVPTEKIPFTGTAGWGKDYPDAFTYFLYLFDGRSITPEFTYNEPLVGLTEEQAQEIGIDYPADGVPSVDAGIDECIAIADSTERLTCWGNLTKVMMEEIVPWVPFIWRNATTIIAPSVTSWAFDQATGNSAWVHVAVDPSKQQTG